MELKEYIVTLHRHEDLEGFYDDMETPGGSLYIPDRAVDFAARRPISRNTHYMLTDEEAELVKKDERVWDAVDKSTIPPRRLSYIDQSNNWDKRPWNEEQDSNHKNWALLRCTETENRPDWGSDDTFNQTGSISVTSSGRNVDIIIADGLVNREHVEFLDSEGQSRVKYYNWYQHTSEITGGTTENGTYPQPTVSEQNNFNCNHATHVAGTAAGNNYGWARNANIYNIAAVGYSDVYNLYQSGDYVIYNSDGTSVETINQPSEIFANYAEYDLGSSDLFFDYIRLFHKYKPINPETGLKNPTIVNASIGRLFPFNRNNIDFIQFYNVTSLSIYGPADGSFFSDSELVNFGLINYNSEYVYFNVTLASEIAELEDLLNDGIIYVGSAGNDKLKMVNSDDPSYDNFLISGNYENPTAIISYMRGSSLAIAPGSICVGSIGDTKNESKASYSNTGSRVDIYSPGTSIMSSVNGPDRQSQGKIIIQPVVDHPDDSAYKIHKYRGTSMAAPQVTGVLACHLETNPRLSPSDALDLVVSTSLKGQITDTGGGFTDEFSLQGAPNRYLYYKKQRETQGYVTAQLTNNVRKPSGMLFPRRRLV